MVDNILRTDDAAPRPENAAASQIAVLAGLAALGMDLATGASQQGQFHHKRRKLYTETFLCMFNSEDRHRAADLA